jgi:protein involved in polysaccharide export with SLBB domain
LVKPASGLRGFKAALCSVVVAQAFFAILMFGTSRVSAQTLPINTPTGSGGFPSGQTTLVAPIGAGDELHVSVVGQPDLSTDYQVDGNGDITLLYVGKIHVSGMTPDEAATAVKHKLGTIYVDPEVTLTRAAMGGDTITVTGSVMHQGTETTRRDSTLNDIIQMATPQTDADLTKVQITRGLPGQQHNTSTFDVASFLNTGDQKNNPQLADGDVIFVPSKTAVNFSVSCMGAIVKPGRFYVAPGTTVADLITQAGGLNDDADKSNIYVQPIGTTDHRTFDYTKATQSPADPTLNPQLSDGDEVVISELQVKPIISITGGVMKPGTYPIDGRVSLTDAEGYAGGISDRAQVNKTQITRLDGKGASTVIYLDAHDPQIAANFILEPGDNVYIPPGRPSHNLDPLGIFSALGGVLSIFRL